MPRTHPPEFRRRAVELAFERAKPLAQIAKDLGISESCLRRWIDLAAVETAARKGPPRLNGRAGELRRKLRARRWRTRSCPAAAYFARENVLPK